MDHIQWACFAFAAGIIIGSVLGWSGGHIIQQMVEIIIEPQQAPMPQQPQPQPQPQHQLQLQPPPQLMHHHHHVVGDEPANELTNHIVIELFLEMEITCDLSKSIKYTRRNN
jgi:hypothetical protein